MEYAESSGEDPVFLLFEGTCPDCSGDVRITHIGGTVEFFEDETFTSDADKNIWSGGGTIEDPTDANIEFKCTECKQTFTISHNIYGDWNL